MNALLSPEAIVSMKAVVLHPSDDPEVFVAGGPYVTAEDIAVLLQTWDLVEIKLKRKPNGHAQ